MIPYGRPKNGVVVKTCSLPISYAVLYVAKTLALEEMAGEILIAPSLGARFITPIAAPAVRRG